MSDIQKRSHARGRAVRRRGYIPHTKQITLYQSPSTVTASTYVVVRFSFFPSSPPPCFILTSSLLLPPCVLFPSLAASIPLPSPIVFRFDRSVRWSVVRRGGGGGGGGEIYAYQPICRLSLNIGIERYIRQSIKIRLGTWLVICIVSFNHILLSCTVISCFPVAAPVLLQ